MKLIHEKDKITSTIVSELKRRKIAVGGCFTANAAKRINTGKGTKATNILALNPNAITTPNIRYHRYLFVWTAFTMLNAAISAANATSASGSLRLSITTATGSTARTIAAINPDKRP